MLIQQDFGLSTELISTANVIEGQRTNDAEACFEQLFELQTIKDQTKTDEFEHIQNLEKQKQSEENKIEPDDLLQSFPAGLPFIQAFESHCDPKICFDAEPRSDLTTYNSIKNVLSDDYRIPASFESEQKSSIEKNQSVIHEYPAFFESKTDIHIKQKDKNMEADSAEDIPLDSSDIELTKIEADTLAKDKFQTTPETNAPDNQNHSQVVMNSLRQQHKIEKIGFEPKSTAYSNLVTNTPYNERSIPETSFNLSMTSTANLLDKTTAPIAPSSAGIPDALNVSVEPEQITSGVHKATVSIQQPELGTVIAKIEVNPEKSGVTLIANNYETQQVIQTHLAQLKEFFSDARIQMDYFNNQHTFSQDSSQNKERHTSQTQVRDESSEVNALTSSHSKSNTLYSNSLIDTYV